MRAHKLTYSLTHTHTYIHTYIHTTTTTMGFRITANGLTLTIFALFAMAIAFKVVASETAYWTTFTGCVSMACYGLCGGLVCMAVSV